MLFICLVKNRVKQTKELIAKADKLTKKMPKGVKILSHYWTLGRYDDVVLVEAPDEKAIMKALLTIEDLAATETLVAIPRDEAIKLLE